ncbi:hypothetical protein FGO68_gene7100 [Halteria grandinella]|uniref:Uncharacterized protein n=1 Tax=Halteria grandinella TaxID=5974 RepID=A0A8J8P1T1_HALGN|nr:hypothetical protein FGO68_gene7100 [Halteria grandinella]
MGYPFIQDLQPSDIKNLIEVHVSPNHNSTDRDYTWTCESIQNSSFVIRVTFKEVLDLTDRDRLRLGFKNASGFYLNSNNSAYLRVRLAKNFKIDKYVPPQKQLEDNSKINRIGNQAGIGLKSLLYANFGMNLIMAASMQLLWGLINSLQLVVRTPLMGMKFPSHTKAFFSSFVMLTNFDILPSSDLNELVFGFESDEYEDNYTDLGYDSLNTVDNIGSFLYYLILILSVIILAKITQLIGIEFSFHKQATCLIDNFLGQQLAQNQSLTHQFGIQSSASAQRPLSTFLSVASSGLNSSQVKDYNPHQLMQASQQD